MFGATLAIPLIIANDLCIGDDEQGQVAKGEIISTLFFVSGLVTLLQTTFGSRSVNTTRSALKVSTWSVSLTSLSKGAS